MRTCFMKKCLILLTLLNLMVTVATLAAPVAEYRFDETQYNDVADEVTDSINGFNGQSKVAQTVAGKVCNALDLSATNTSDYVILDRAVLDAATDFSISLWERTSNEDRQAILSGANSVSFNELIFWFTRATTFTPFLKDTANGVVTIPSIADGRWQHLVWTRSGDQSCLYQNKVQVACRTQSTAALAIESLILGQEQDSLGGGFDSDQGFEGLIDELLIFNEALSLTEIEEIYANQDAGLGYDGSVRACDAITPDPLLEYRFEEESWNGSSDEIIDNTSNGHHGRVNNNSTPEIDTPALSGNPGTCGYASQNDGSIEVTGLPLDTTTRGVKTTATFWMYWDGTDSVMPIGWNFHDIWMVSGYIGFNTWNNDLYGLSSSGLANGWHHVAVEFTNGDVTSNRMHINGVEQSLTQISSTSPVNSRAFVNSALRVGGVSNSTFFDFHGFIDEFRIYESALSTAQINTIMAERHACTAEQIDHYEISHDGDGVTCSAEPITIKACLNSACTSLSTTEITLDLQASSTSGSTTENSVTFANGSTTIPFSHFISETLTLSIANETITASNATSCDNMTDSSCDITFNDSTFVFDIPTQTSCETSGNITISALHSDSAASQCAPLFSNTVKTLNFWTDYHDPNIGTRQLSFTHNNNTELLSGSTETPIDITFDINGEASFTINYPDAGQLILNASYQGSGAEEGLTIAGSTLFTNVPATLIVESNDSNADCVSADANCSAFIAADETFNLSVSAACNDATITPNFKMDNIPLTVETVAPDLGNLVYLGVKQISITEGGSNTEPNQTISEVGVFSITAAPVAGGYFNESIGAASSASIGRFIPQYFTLSDIDNGTLNGGDPFVYTGQMRSATEGQISYENTPSFIINAKSATDNTTANYTGDFIKLSIDNITRETPTHDTTQDGANGDRVDLTATLNEATLSGANGELQYRFNSTDNYVYTRNSNAIIAPFSADIDLQITSIIDSDAVTANDIDSDLTNGILLLSPVGEEIRFGRWVIQNSYGSEVLDQRVPMQVQYWNGSNFTTNGSDSFSSFEASDATIIENNLTPTSPDPVIYGLGMVSDGETNNLMIAAPGMNIRDSISIELAVPSWLQYDWNDDGAYDNDPSAQINFGLYRSNDRIICRMEVF